MLQALLVRKIAQIILLDRSERGLKFEKENEYLYAHQTLIASWADEMTTPANYIHSDYQNMTQSDPKKSKFQIPLVIWDYHDLPASQSDVFE